MSPSHNFMESLVRSKEEGKGKPVTIGVDNQPLKAIKGKKLLHQLQIIIARLISKDNI